MNRDRILTITSCLTIGYIFLPIIFRNIPIPGIGKLIYGLLIVSFILLRPKLLFTRQFSIIYFFFAVYAILSPTIGHGSNWLESRLLDLVLPVLLYANYFNFQVKKVELEILFWFSFTAIIIGSLTTLYGLSLYPMASRELASSVYGNVDKTHFYKSIGILGYGFASALAYFVPIPIVLYRYYQSYNKKILLALVVILTTMTMTKTQYTGQYIMFVGAISFSLIGVKIFRKYQMLFVVIFFSLILVPKESFIPMIDIVALQLPEGEFKSKFYDLSNTLTYSDIEEAGATHMGSRYQRIPLLISEIKKSPLIGGGIDTGHVFWLDHLSAYGLIGIIPWLLLLLNNYKKVKSILNENFYYYRVALTMFILLGFMKGSGSKEQLIVLFFILPLGLYLHKVDSFIKMK